MSDNESKRLPNSFALSVSDVTLGGSKILEIGLGGNGSIAIQFAAGPAISLTLDDWMRVFQGVRGYGATIPGQRLLRKRLY